MKRGKSEAETCALNGWPVGTLLRGWEAWSEGGVWTTIRITAIGEWAILARCIRHERVLGDQRDDSACNDGEHMWTLQDREWAEHTPPQVAVGDEAMEAAGDG